MAAYFSSPSKSEIIVLDELEMEEKNLRKNRIDDILATETELRRESETNGVVSEYFKTLHEKETACINKKCCKSFCKGCDKVCCFFCRGKQRCCGLIIAIFIILVVLFVLTQLGYIKKPSSYANDN